tara:strand:- start:834 stop:1145 length:312 start_codon:yes stop_codon:yes gene_type:complete
MIKLRQINSSNVCVTRNTPDGQPLIQKDYSLSDIWVNPRAILYLQEDSALVAENKRNPLMEGLNENHTFTKLLISENGFARQLSIIGEPSTINNLVEEHAKNG